MSSALAASVTLTWTAVGDDSLSGTAYQYDLRYSTLPITDANFSTSTKYTLVPPPSPAGSPQVVIVSGLTLNTTYYFALKTADERLNWSKISNIAIRTPTASVGVDDGVTLHFSTPFPNPSHERASFSFGLPRAGDVSIEAFDVTGRHIRTLMSGTHPAGENTLVWDLRDESGRPLATGLYLVRARLGEQSFLRRVIVQR